VPLTGERASLLRALSTVALTERRKSARRFLQGLSTEELRYIASYLGACLLESAERVPSASRDQIAWDILNYESSCRGTSAALPCDGDVAHNMILLLEYLSTCRCAAAVKVVAGSA
jgi:hypothetical protein